MKIDYRSTYTIDVPKDLRKVKPTVMFNLTLRQLVHLVIGGGLGITVYFLTRGSIGQQAASYLVVLIALPIIFLGMYEKNGFTADRLLFLKLRHKVLLPEVRRYRKRTENKEEAVNEKGKGKNSKPGAKQSGKKAAGKELLRENETEASEDGFNTGKHPADNTI